MINISDDQRRWKDINAEGLCSNGYLVTHSLSALGQEFALDCKDFSA